MEPTGTIYFRRFTQEEGLKETQYEFATLAELFSLIMDVQPPNMVDRVAIVGHDGQGKKRIINFTFQSIRIVES